jgi:hypothetical protein
MFEVSVVVLPVFCTFIETVTFWPLVTEVGDTETEIAMGPIDTVLDTEAFDVALAADMELAVPLTTAPLLCATAAVLSPLVQPVKLFTVNPVYLISSLSIITVPEEGQPAVETTGSVTAAALIFAVSDVAQVEFEKVTVPVASARYVYKIVPCTPALSDSGLGL